MAAMLSLAEKGMEEKNICRGNVIEGGKIGMVREMAACKRSEIQYDGVII